ncbi:MAG: hypothetical protein EBU90_07380 [Proteobacteria bacterium]|nr:hypothetical protein [Pseudomonadota bacterium]NBP13475.1 hypothetical protein [bacterium]
MIVVDYNQTAISNFMAEVGNRTDIEINVPLLRHMIVNSLRGYKQKFGKQYGDIVIACDNIKYWRRDVFPLYKAGRKKAREESGFDWKVIFEALNSIRDDINSFFPYKVVNVEGAEADDVIAVLAEWSQTKDLMNASPFAEGDPKPFLIISGDHDFKQLQRFKNVKQFSPIQKKYVAPDTTAERYVLEHTIRGDKGDGIPNAFSADDCLVKGIKQKSISTKKLEGWLDDPTTLPNDEEFLSNFYRNKTLVDFRCIPDNVKHRILDTFEVQPDKNKSKLLNYFIEHKMKNMLEVIEEF